MRFPFADRIIDFARGRKPDREPTVSGSAKPPKGEIGVVADEFLQALGIDTENPDQQIEHFGMEQLQEWAIKDCTYRNCLRILKAAVLAREIDVEPYSEEQIDQDAKALLEWGIANIQGTFKRDLREALDAASLGYSVQEIVWGEVPLGEFAGRVWIKELRHKPPQKYRFKVNKYGRVEQLKQESGLGWDRVPIEKFIIFSYDSLYENPYGRGLMSSCAWPIWFKKNGVKFLNVYAEKFAMPTAKIEVPAQANPGDEEKVMEILRALQAGTGIKIPTGFAVEFLEATRRGDGAYQYLLEWCDRQITYVMLGVEMATSSGEKGTYGLGKAQIEEIFEGKIAQDLAEEIENLLAEQYTKRLIDYNYHVDGYPEIKLRLPKSYAELDAPTLQLLLEAGLELPITWAQDRWGIPEGEDGEPMLTKAGIKIKGEEPDPENLPADEIPEGVMCELAERDKGWRDPWITDFTEGAGKREDAYIATAMSEINPLLRQAMDAYLEQIEARQIIENKSVEALTELRPDYSGIKDLLSRLLYVGSLAGITDAQRLVWRTGWRPIAEIEGGIFSDQDGSFMELADPEWTTIPEPAEVLEQFGSLQKVTRDVYDIGLLNGNAFTIAYTESSSAVKLVHGHVLEAIQNGWGFKDFRAALLNDSEFLKRYSGSEGARNAHWETVFRTNMNAAYNRGRLDFYGDPDLAGYIVAYRYNAILDDRVRPAHAAMDGRIFAADSPIWSEWLPPNGYNCRCYIDPVPATAYAGESGKPLVARTTDGKTVAVQPDEGFGRRVTADAVPVRLPKPEPVPVGKDQGGT